MQYGAMNHPILPVLDEIEAVAAMGFDYLELAMDAPQAHHAKIRSQERRILQALAASGLDLVCHLPTFLHLADLTPRIREASLLEMKAALHAAAALAPRKVVLHPPYIGGLGPLVMEHSMALALESLEILFAEAARLGLTVCLENMFPKYPGWIDPGDFVPLFERFPALELTLDVGHAHIGSKRDDRILSFIHTFGRRIGHVHVSDNRGKADEHLPVGDGTIDFEKILKALKRAGYEGALTLEIFSSNRHDVKRSRNRIEGLLLET